MIPTCLVNLKAWRHLVEADLPTTGKLDFNLLTVGREMMHLFKPVETAPTLTREMFAPEIYDPILDLAEEKGQKVMIQMLGRTLGGEYAQKWHVLCTPPFVKPPLEVLPRRWHYAYTPWIDESIQRAGQIVRRAEQFQS